jgi:tRNA dimethylallyltransferase
MGPTASGKTGAAISLCKRFPFDIISVDSALVYRGMDVGTAKPDRRTLERVPHRLIDIRDPEEPYSAGEFVRDARAEMGAIFRSGRVPLLVGGTMMYFRALTEGIAELPSADEEIRDRIDADAADLGWPALHARLEEIDPEAAARINPNDSQRIQRALEVYMASGRTISAWQRTASEEARDDRIRYVKIGLLIEPRSILHERIRQRLDSMLEEGFLTEMRTLMNRPGLRRDSPAMRSVGYRQFWAHLEGECSLDEALHKALAATRQLAKRQHTWLRSEDELALVDPLESGAIDAISGILGRELG